MRYIVRDSHHDVHDELEMKETSLQTRTSREILLNVSENKVVREMKMEIHAVPVPSSFFPSTFTLGIFLWSTQLELGTVECKTPVKV